MEKKRGNIDNGVQFDLGKYCQMKNLSIIELTEQNQKEKEKEKRQKEKQEQDQEQNQKQDKSETISNTILEEKENNMNNIILSPATEASVTEIFSNFDLARTNPHIPYRNLLIHGPPGRYVSICLDSLL